MTSLYIYAILPPGVEVPPDLSGFHQAPLRTVESGRLSALVAAHEREVPEPTEERVTAHHQVVVRLREFCPALPVRFGTIIQGHDALAAQLRDQSDAFVSLIERLDGMVEYGLTVLWGSRQRPLHPPSSPEPSATTGTGYMRQRLAAYQQERKLRGLAESVGADIETELSPIASDVQVTVLPTASIPLRSKFLVEADHQRRFEDAFARVKEKRADLRFLLVGPWPPYSFSAGADSSLGTHGAGALQGQAKPGSLDLLSRLIADHT